MRIEHLQECIKLAQTLSFTETAKALYVSQPVLSKHISAIEHELGVRLFDRDQQGVRLTPIGESFVERIRGIVDEYEFAVSEVDQAKRGCSTTLTVGCLYGASYPILPMAANRFTSKHPEVFLRVKTFEIDSVVDALDAGTIDVSVLTSYNMDVGHMGYRYGWVPLYPDSICIVVPKTFPEAQAESLGIEDLKGRTLVQPCAPFMTRSGDDLLGIFAPAMAELDVRRSILDVNSLILSMKSKKNIALSFGHLQYVLGDDFACVPLREAAGIRFDVGALWLKSDESPALAAFVEHLEREAERMKAGGGSLSLRLRVFSRETQRASCSCGGRDGRASVTAMGADAFLEGARFTADGAALARFGKAVDLATSIAHGTGIAHDSFLQSFVKKR